MYDEALAARVRAVLAKRSDVTESDMMGGHQFLVNGHICCSVRRDTLTVRVLPESMPELQAIPGVRPMKLGARTMRGFVRIDNTAIRSNAELKGWVDRGIVAARTRSSE